jgi:hypothetical protein
METNGNERSDPSGLIIKTISTRTTTTTMGTRDVVVPVVIFFIIVVVVPYASRKPPSFVVRFPFVFRLDRKISLERASARARLS